MREPGMAWIQRSLVGCPIDKRGRVVKDFGVQQGSILWHSGLLFLQAETTFTRARKDKQ